MCLCGPAPSCVCVCLQLEFIGGEIWSNVWQSECIARICPDTGRVKAWLLMQGLGQSLQQRNLATVPMDVLNGETYVVAKCNTNHSWWPAVAALPDCHLRGTGCDDRPHHILLCWTAPACTAVMCEPLSSRCNINLYTACAFVMGAGIAWDHQRQRLFITGKQWPRVFEVVPQPLDASNTAAQQAKQTCYVKTSPV